MVEGERGMDGCLDGWMMYMARGTKWMDFAPGFTYFFDRSRRHLSVFAVGAVAAGL